MPGFSSMAGTLGETSLLHANDPNPVRIYADTGNISDLELYLPKLSDIVAGNDITNIAFYLQNDNEDDVSVVEAGRDIIPYDPDDATREAALQAAEATGTLTQQQLDDLLPQPLPGDITIGGPGTLEVLAGRNLTLYAAGSSTGSVATGGVGLESIGNASNPYLPLDDGAQIIAAAGLGLPEGAGLASDNADFPAFITDFLDPATAGVNATRFLPELGELLNMDGASDQDIWNAFESEPSAQQTEIALDMFYIVLRDAGRDHNNGDVYGGYDVGYAAIAALFPGTQWSGNISLTGREVATTSGGDIDLLAPGGSILVGYDLADKQPLDQGILTLSSGNINIFSKESVTVGTSRIFTFKGGNEIIWSTYGNIAAGAASKTLQEAPPTQFFINPETGVATLDVAGLATGGGIGVLQTVAGAPAGNIDLVAPNGYVDAGDAGIRVSGNINIAAVQVLNAGNITVGGTATGIPTVQAPNIAGLTAASNTAGAASKTVASPALNNSNAEQPSILIVEVEGYGGGEGDDTDNSNDQKKRRP